MRDTTANWVENLRSHQAVLVLLAALVLTAAVYLPGLGGSFHFDDTPNLEGLANVTDLPSAARFATEGVAGPLGRPVALATFALQAYAWPNAPHVFLYVNVCIHLLNGMLVAWALFLLTTARSCSVRQAAWAASMSAAIWMLMPILASSSLLIVQRMTTLSATFSLLGLIGYLYARSSFDRRPMLALFAMTVALGAGAVLAALAKENGVLLPVFVLVAEGLLLSRPSRATSALLWRAWFCVALVAPAVVLVAYLVSYADYPESVVLMRGFSVSDRLLTQAHVLWEYLYNAFLPATSHLGPFHDDYPVRTEWLHPRSLLAVGGWMGLVALAIYGRRAYPLFGFAVAWYLVGHSLESTTIPLELYFEHRNYLPLIGPIYALVSALTSSQLPQLPTRIGLAAYALILAGVSFSTTSLWGRPALAAEIWYIEHPHSTRAVQYVAQRLSAAGDLHGARRVLKRFAEEHPASSASALQALVFSCTLEPNEDHRALLETIETNLPNAAFEFAVFDAVRDLYHITSSGECESIDRGEVYELIATIAALPVFQAVPVMQHNLHMLMSEEGLARRNLDMTMRHIEAALESHYTMPSLVRAIQMLVSAGLYSTAEEFVRDAYRHTPNHPIQAVRWKHGLALLEQALEAVKHE